MGVKDLWNILSPLCDRQPLFELQGKTVAIDLSCWVVDSQQIINNQVQPKMYLRNLFFRTCFLLTHGIMPVFVLEGKAPTLKHGTMAKRNDIRAGNHVRQRKQTGARSQFNRILKECKQMLEFMGLVCVQGHGEAEAMCAYLNEDGLVDGCISQDSDCFLYGAKVVYRNFCTSAQGNRGGTGGAVDTYCIDKIEEVLNLGRNKMIAMALLCGCDYDEGLNGVGKEAALKFLKIVDDEDVIERMKSWKTSNILDQKEAELSQTNICTSCGHPGKVQKHSKSGCIDCGTIIKCNDSYKEERLLVLNEIALRKKALLQEDFPSQELLDEFLVRGDAVPTKLDLQWRQPKIEKFVDFMEKHLSWEPQYAFEKLFPLVTRWQLLNLPNIPSHERLSIPDLFFPVQIKKIRNIRSTACYEIIWNRDHDIIKKLEEYAAYEKENDETVVNELPVELTSIEPQHEVLNCYTNLVEEFELARNAKSKKRPTKTRSRKNANTENIPDPSSKDKQKRETKKANKGKNNRKIDEFINVNKVLSLEDSFDKLTITPKRSKMSSTPIKRGPQFDKVLQMENIQTKLNNTLDRMFNELSPDDFLSDCDQSQDLNMTDIIDKICSKRNFDVDMRTVNKATVGDETATTSSSLNENQNEALKETAILDTAVNDKDCLQKSKENDDCNESVDEFGAIDEAYVPLNQRLAHGEKETSKRSQKKLSFGIDSLMNETNFDNC